MNKKICPKFSAVCNHISSSVKMALTISFKDQKVLITGASRGLGYALVKALYAQGAVITAVSQNPENLVKLKSEFPNISTICVDLSDWKVTKLALEDIGPVNCLINNAGIGSSLSLLDLTEEHFDEILAVNLKAAIIVSQVVAKGMIAAGTGGSIVNVSSILSKNVLLPNASAYSISKAGLDMLTKNMAVELGSHKIRVNSVNPGVFPTDMSKQLLEIMPDGGQVYSARNPAKRILHVEEVVNTILFLLSDATPMINAQNIVIDGGVTAS